MLPCASLLLRSSASSRDSGLPMSWVAFEIGRWLGFVEMEWKMWKRWRWWPKWSSLNPRLLADYIGGDQLIRKGIAALNPCHLWRSFSVEDHTACMQGHTGRMRYVAAACDLGWACGPLVGVRAWSRTWVLSVLVWFSWNKRQGRAESNLKNKHAYAIK
jgi:hypothetical protein